MRIFLIGFMGSGKTTIGRQLAKQLGLSFIDQDSLIESKMHMTVSEIFATHGEEFFRQTERAVLDELSERENIVVATGGGAPCFEGNIDLMNNTGITIYLKTSPGVLAARLRNANSTRPLIAGKSEPELLAYINTKLTEREPFYEKARLSIDANSLSPDDIIRILKEMKYYW